MTKYNIGDKFILEITGIDNETIMEGYPKPAYRIRGMEGPFSENVLDGLERIEANMAAGDMTNGDRIRLRKSKDA